MKELDHKQRWNYKRQVAMRERDQLFCTDVPLSLVSKRLPMGRCNRSYLIITITVINYEISQNYMCKDD